MGGGGWGGGEYSSKVKKVRNPAIDMHARAKNSRTSLTSLRSCVASLMSEYI